MISLLTKTLLTAFLLGMAAFANATVIHVDIDATGLNDGSTWTDAFTNLQDGLDAAVPNDEIWVADGTYNTSTSGSGGFGFTFQTDLITLYGGFDGSEILLEQRDYTNNLVILSGNEGDPLSTADNAYQVMLCTGDDLIIDGVIVEDGNAHGNGGQVGEGGGAYIYRYATFRNCWFRNNLANDWGGAISVASSYNLSQSGDLDLYNCQFTDNYSDWGAGAVSYFTTYKDAIISGCIFNNNSCLRFGGAICSVKVPDHGYTILLDHCQFLNNSSDEWGGAIRCNNSIQLNNCLIANNSAPLGGWFHSSPNTGNTITIGNCTAVDNSSSLSQPGFYISDYVLDPYSLYVYNSIFWNTSLDEEFLILEGTVMEFKNNISSVDIDFSAVTATLDVQNLSLENPNFINSGVENYHITNYSPATNRGDNALTILATDLDGFPRVQSSTVDLGCYEVQDCSMMNNLCSNSIQIQVDAPSVFGSTLCANINGDPISSCNTEVGRTVWYHFQMSVNANVEIVCDNVQGFGTDFNLKVSAYSSSNCTSPIEIGCENSNGANIGETLILPNLISGEIYGVRVEGVLTQEGSFRIAVDQLAGSPVLGCTDTTACNYDSAADTDDGLCVLPDGCTDSTACNYDSTADCDNGSCTVDDACGVCGGSGTVAGCTDNSACNYDSTADCDDGLCEYSSCADCCGVLNGDGTTCDGVCGACNDDTSCYGCTYAAATNYDSTATIDDGSCVFEVCDITSNDQAVYDGAYADGAASVVCPENPCPGDFDGNLEINTGDLLTFLTYFGANCE